MELLVVVTANFNLAATAGFLDPFRAANYLDGQRHYQWTLASLEGGACMASDGVELSTKPLSAVRANSPDMVIVSSSWTPERFDSPLLNRALRRWAKQGAVLTGLDTGAFILAQAGLLEGRRATVHYEHIDAMLEVHPETETTEDLYVIDGDRMTCCGGMASVDLALHIVKHTQGEMLANAAARYIYHERMRPPGTHQIPNPAEPLGATTPSTVRRAIKLMEEHLEDPIAIPEIAAAANVSQRQLNRLFARYVQRSPVSYYRDIRLDRARGLVTQTDRPIAEVAVACGFASHGQFSRAYQQRFGLSPKRDRTEGRVPFEFRAWPMYRPDNRARS